MDCYCCVVCGASRAGIGIGIGRPGTLCVAALRTGVPLLSRVLCRLTYLGGGKGGGGGCVSTTDEAMRYVVRKLGCFNPR